VVILLASSDGGRLIRCGESIGQGDFPRVCRVGGGDPGNICPCSVEGRSIQHLVSPTRSLGGRAAQGNWRGAAGLRRQSQVGPSSTNSSLPCDPAQPNARNQGAVLLSNSLGQGSSGFAKHSSSNIECCTQLQSPNPGDCNTCRCHGTREVMGKFCPVPHSWGSRQQ